MRILFDQGTPAPLRDALGEHVVATAYELGWSRLSNGELMRAAEAERYDVLVTTDQNLRYQQNLADRRIAIVVLSSPSWPRIRQCIPAIQDAIAKALPRSYVELKIV